MNPQTATTTTFEDQDNCLLCAVRALTEGEPAAKWRGRAPGDEVSGVVLRVGSEPHTYGRNGRMVFLDLWTGGTGRIRIWAGPATLENAITTADLKVGDRVVVRYTMDATLNRPGSPLHGKSFKVYNIDVKRGHH